MPRLAPTQKKDREDQREWTTPQQKAYLNCLRPSSAKAREKGDTKAWYNIELAAYFAAFPTGVVTVKEGVAFSKKWTERDKWAQEEVVSS